VDDHDFVRVEHGGGLRGLITGDGEVGAAEQAMRSAPANSTATSMLEKRRATSSTTSSEALSPQTYSVGSPSLMATNLVIGPVAGSAVGSVPRGNGRDPHPAPAGW
jgi:hypothetical protein